MRIVTVLAVLVAACSVGCFKPGGNASSAKVWTEADLNKAVLHSKTIDEVKAVLGEPAKAVKTTSPDGYQAQYKFTYHQIVKEDHSGRLVDVDIWFVEAGPVYHSFRVTLSK